MKSTGQREPGGVDFVLRSSRLQVGLCALGAAIAFVQLQQEGGWVDIALRAHSREDHCGGTYAGCTVGPSAGRIRNAALGIDGQPLALDANDGAHCLHGGAHNLADVHFTTAHSETHADGGSLRFAAVLPDGLCGFPGNREIAVTYTLAGAQLHIAYTATTDKPTWLNLTNHSYWNLSGNFGGSCLDHELYIPARQVYENDADHLPLCKTGVAGTPFDFTVPATPGHRMAEAGSGTTLQKARGYNNAYLLDARDDGLCAQLAHPPSGRRLRMYTDYPALVLYTGGYLQPAFCALALEAQYLPDAPNLAGAAAPILRPGEEYRHSIRFAFETHTPHSTTLRAARPADAAAIVNIQNQSFWADQQHYGYCPGYGHSEEEVRAVLLDPAADTYLMEECGLPIGCLTVTRQAPGAYFLTCLCVLPQRQGRGIGSRALQWLRTRYPRAARWRLVTPLDKEENIRFYEAHGFATVDEHSDGGVRLAVMEWRGPSEA